MSHKDKHHVDELLADRLEQMKNRNHAAQKSKEFSDRYRQEFERNRMTSGLAIAIAVIGVLIAAWFIADLSEPSPYPDDYEYDVPDVCYGPGGAIPC